MSEQEIVLIGGKPGSGKSRLAIDLTRFIHQETPLRAAHVSLGERMRAIAGGLIDSHYTLTVADHLARPDGTVLPIADDVAGAVAAEAIDEHSEADILLIDGYPRYESQVAMFEETVRDREHTIRGLIVTDASYDTAAERLRRRSMKDPHRSLREDEIQLRLLQYELTYPAVIRSLGAHGVRAIEITTEYEKERTNALGRRALLRLVKRPATWKPEAS